MRNLLVALGMVWASLTLSAQGNPHDNTITLLQDPSAIHFGDTVSFNYTVSPKVDQPGIQVLCYKDGALVYAYGGYPIGAYIFNLSSSAWINAGGGAADCEGQLVSLTTGPRNNSKVLASVAFHVQP